MRLVCRWPRCLACRWPQWLGNSGWLGLSVWLGATLNPWRGCSGWLGMLRPVKLATMYRSGLQVRGQLLLRGHQLLELLMVARP